jgi:hypothetical protein
MRSKIHITGHFENIRRVFTTSLPRFSPFKGSKRGRQRSGKYILSRSMNNLIPLFLILSLTACYEEREGCLDIEATNYDFSADVNVTDDCQYPSLQLVINHVYSINPDSTEIFRLQDSVYLDQNGHPFTIADLRFYISNLRLLSSDGTVFGVEEDLTIYTTTTGDTIQQQIEDNFAIASPGFSQTYTIGTLRESFTLSGIQFTVGVESPANDANPALMPSNHPLSLQDGSLYFSADSGYVFNYISLFRDTTAADTIPEILRIGTSSNLKTIELDTQSIKNNGVDFTITLQVDYQKWFEAIDVASDANEVLIEKIVSGLTESFSLLSAE